VSWWPRHFAAWLAALTSLALLLALANVTPRKSKGVSVLVASNPRSGSCGDGPPLLIVHVTPTGLLLNDRQMSASEIKNYLRHATRNLVERVVFVDGDPTARFADVADVFSMLHELRIQAAMLTLLWSPVPMRVCLLGMAGGRLALLF